MGQYMTTTELRPGRGLTINCTITFKSGVKHVKAWPALRPLLLAFQFLFSIASFTASCGSIYQCFIEACDIVLPTSAIWAHSEYSLACLALAMHDFFSMPCLCSLALQRNFHFRLLIAQTRDNVLTWSFCPPLQYDNRLSWTTRYLRRGPPPLALTYQRVLKRS